MRVCLCEFLFFINDVSFQTVSKICFYFFFWLWFLSTVYVVLGSEDMSFNQNSLCRASSLILR